MRLLKIMLVLFALTALAGCVTPAVPPALQAQADVGLDLAQVRENPQAYMGKTVLWGGRIIRSINRKKGTIIEVLELPLDDGNRPMISDNSHGRFIVTMNGYLETALYAQGREVTVVGVVHGVEELPLGEIKYKYVLLRGKEIKLWEKRPQEAVRVYQTPVWGFSGGMGPYPYWYAGPYLWW